MVVIFSIETDTTTHRVMDWLHALHEPFVVIYPKNIAQKILSVLRYVEAGNKPSFWFRKWLKVMDRPDYVDSEAQKLIDYLYHITKDSCFWLNVPADFGSNNKLIQSSISSKCGLNVAENSILNHKEGILHLIKSNSTQKYITKSFGSAVERNDENGDVYFAYTQLVDEDMLAKAPMHIFPSLVQRYIDKEFEIRTFFLDGQCFSMAIFSQENDKTKVDFRHYDVKTPNRNEPIRLPVEIEERLRRFVSEMGTNCGSFDLIQDKIGQIYFVEFNPLGQFGMVSHPCGYTLEKRVAQLLKENVGQCEPVFEFEAHDGECELPLCAYNMQMMEIMGVDVCYRSPFYESVHAAIDFPFKPIDTRL